jgi:hypothetical protein
MPRLTTADAAGSRRAKHSEGTDAVKRKHGDQEGSRRNDSYVEELEAEFAHRYTSDDQHYMKLKSRPLSEPPIVCPW